MKKKYGKQNGAASIFIVIFFTLLIGVITLSFVRIVGNDRQQALNTDLSQSAYDSAQAGVEDAKRTLDRCLKDQPSGCKQQLLDGHKFNGSGDCKDTQEAMSSGGEVSVGQEEHTRLNQAYTCVNMTYFTDDYENEIRGQSADIIPLEAAPGGVISEIDLAWFSEGDTNNGVLTYRNSNPSLPTSANVWGATTPPIMRVQVISMNASGGSIEEINNNSKTFFLYPTNDGAILTESINISTLPTRNSEETPPGDKFTIVGAKINEPQKVRCEDSFSDSTEFACKVKLMGFETDKKNYLIITPIYSSSTHFNLELPTGIEFNGVQPKIDSTGRADDVFRRIETRVRFDRNPVGGLSFDVADSICKAFSMTNTHIKADNSSCPIIGAID